jgi:hypothetical protein
VPIERFRSAGRVRIAPGAPLKTRTCTELD